MNERRTLSILHRLKVILSVTAKSYGLGLQGKTKPPEGGFVSGKQRPAQLQLEGTV